MSPLTPETIAKIRFAASTKLNTLGFTQRQPYQQIVDLCDHAREQDVRIARMKPLIEGGLANVERYYREEFMPSEAAKVNDFKARCEILQKRVLKLQQENGALNENLASMQQTNTALLKKLHDVGEVPEKFHATMSRLKTPKKGELRRILIQLLP